MNPDKKLKASTVRVRHKCPFPLCASEVFHLPRHMRLTHGWSREDARNVVSKFNLRKSRSKSGKSKQRKLFSCPIPRCQSVVKRIHNHLTQVHKARSGSKRYNEMLFAAKLNEINVISSSESSMSDDSEFSSEGSQEYPVYRSDNGTDDNGTDDNCNDNGIDDEIDEDDIDLFRD